MLGCGGSGVPIGRVTGTVKFDGKPLPNATLIFQPTDGGRPSTGVTDESGNYALYFTQEDKGAKIGKHAVKISTFQGAYDDGKLHPAGPEKVPEQFNAKAAANPVMTKEVASGSNTIDFELDSKGTIVQPGTKPTAFSASVNVTPAAHTTNGPGCP